MTIRELLVRLQVDPDDLLDLELCNGNRAELEGDFVRLDVMIETGVAGP